MTTDTIKNSVSETFTDLRKFLADFNKKYCPDGNTCNDLVAFGGLAFMFWFMYLAMEPIIRF